LLFTTKDPSVAKCQSCVAAVYEHLLQPFINTLSNANHVLLPFINTLLNTNHVLLPFMDTLCSRL
jgi:hypothetical protein